MWQEFPDDPETYTISSQFMWGNIFLVAPKILAPKDVEKEMKRQEVEFYLPNGSIWYSYGTKQCENNTGKWNRALLRDSE